IDGRRVAHKPYAWNPSHRIERATALDAEQILTRESLSFSPISDPDRYTDAQPEIRLSGPATLHRLAMDRDIYYQPGVGQPGVPRVFRGAHPRENLVILNQD